MMNSLMSKLQVRFSNLYFTFEGDDLTYLVEGKNGKRRIGIMNFTDCKEDFKRIEKWLTKLDVA